MKGSLQVKNDYYYVVTYVKGKDGKKKQKWLSTNYKIGTNKQLVEKRAQEILNQQNNLNSFNCYEISNMNFEIYYNFWLDMKKNRIQPLTQENYIKYGKKITEYFYGKNVKLININSVDLENFLNYLYSNNLSSSTVRHYYITISQCLKYAYKNGWILCNPAEKVEKPKESKSRTNYYNKEEMKLLFLKIENEELKLPIMLSAIYGLRRSEVLGLRWKAIDFLNKKIYVEHKVVEATINNQHKLYKMNTLKTASSCRELPLLPQVEALLLEEKKKQTNKNMRVNSSGAFINNSDLEYVCLDNYCRLIKPSRLTHGFLKVLRKYNLKHIRFHDLRHSCASIMLASNVPMKQIQEWLGHSNYSTTANIYSHLDFKTKLNSAKHISNVYGFLNEKYNINEEKLINMENLTEEEVIFKIKQYQKILKNIRKNKVI